MSIMWWLQLVMHFSPQSLTSFPTCLEGVFASALSISAFTVYCCKSHSGLQMEILGVRIQVKVEAEICGQSDVGDSEGRDRARRVIT